MDEEYYTLRQIDELSFKYDLALTDIDILGDWLDEHYIEGDDFIYGETEFGTHVYTAHVTFIDIETSIAFKLRWF